MWELLQLVNEAREEQANGSVRTVLTVLVVQPCVLSKVCVGSASTSNVYDKPFLFA